MPPNIFKFANWNASPLESPPRNLQKDWKLWSCGRKKHYEYDQVNSFTWPSIILISPFTIYNSKYWSLTALISEVLFYMWYLRCLFWLCFDYNPKIQDMLWVHVFCGFVWHWYLGIPDLACSMRRSTESPWRHILLKGWEVIVQRVIDEMIFSLVNKIYPSIKVRSVIH